MARDTSERRARVRQLRARRYCEEPALRPRAARAAVPIQRCHAGASRCSRRCLENPAHAAGPSISIGCGVAASCKHGDSRRRRGARHQQSRCERADGADAHNAACRDSERARRRANASRPLPRRAERGAAIPARAKRCAAVPCGRSERGLSAPAPPPSAALRRAPSSRAAPRSERQRASGPSRSSSACFSTGSSSRYCASALIRSSSGISCGRPRAASVPLKSGASSVSSFCRSALQQSARSSRHSGSASGATSARR